jgi:hypothetical protein
MAIEARNNTEENGISRRSRLRGLKGGEEKDGRKSGERRSEHAAAAQAWSGSRAKKTGVMGPPQRFLRGFRGLGGSASDPSLKGAGFACALEELPFVLILTVQEFRRTRRKVKNRPSLTGGKAFKGTAKVNGSGFAFSIVAGHSRSH